MVTPLASNAPLLEEVVGGPKSKILGELIERAKLPETMFSTAEELRKVTGLNRVKVYEYLADLERDSLVISSGKQPKKYRVVDTVLLPERLIALKKTAVAQKKEKLEYELATFTKKIEEDGSEITHKGHPERRLAQHLANQEEIYETLEESARLVPSNDFMLCQSPSLTHWALSEEDLSKTKYTKKFLEALRTRLQNKEIFGAIYICPTETSLKRLVQGHSDISVKALYRNLCTVRNLHLLTTEKVLLGSMEIVVFGHMRVVYGLGNEHGILEQGFMIEGSAAASSAHEMLKRIIEDAKYNCLSTYLDELIVAAKARRPNEKKILSELVENVERRQSTRIDLNKWMSSKEMLLANLDEQSALEILKERTVAFLSSLS
jgi:sugar-specific transcriptional regulator TrmB